MKNKLLSARYQADGKATLRLNLIQRNALYSHKAKLASGSYMFESAPCPICTSLKDEQIAQKDRYGIPMDVVICTKCGLIRTNPRMTQESYNDYYANEYRPLYGGKKQSDEEFYRMQYQHGERICSIVTSIGRKINPDMVVVEVGCGAGGILAAFKSRGAHVIGCDLGEKYLELGRARGLELVHGSFENLDLRDGLVDLIIYSHVLEHVLNLRSEIELISKKLKTKGIVYIEVPSVKNLETPFYKGDFLKLLQDAHTFHFTNRSLNNLMMVNGFNCLFGNENVEAIFMKGKSGTWVSDYQSVTTYLVASEKKLLPFWCKKYFIKYLVIRIIPKKLRSFIKRIL